MTLRSALPGLQIESELVSVDAENFRPSSWPPPKDFPVIIDAQGAVISRMGDPVWVLSPWAGKPLLISFGDGESRSVARIDTANADLLRMVDAWWLYGPGAVQTASTLAAKHNSLKPLFAVCAEAGILASDLSRFPAVIEQVAQRISPSEGSKVLSRLNELHAFRDALGFELLDEAALKLFARLLPDHEYRQTAYIPPRIWSYQVLRLRECLEDYLAHRERVEACYRFCVEAYATNARACDLDVRDLPQHSRPFETTVRAGRSYIGRQHYGHFRLTAERFGIDALLDRWTDFQGDAGITAFSLLLSLVSDVGLAYLLNFSLMRIDEGMQLRVGCLSVEKDSYDDVHLVGGIHTLAGVTTKTIQDDDARWIVSPSCSIAVDAMTSVCLLRTHALAQCFDEVGAKTGAAAPLLKTRSHEPWMGQRGDVLLGLRKKGRSYSEVVRRYPKLFDLEKIRISDEDLAIARRMTFGLDQELFSIGKVWPLAWHQLRRTGACNMLGSGLVSESSLQYELKHMKRSSSLYYGQNHYKLNCHLDDEARGYYLREMYSMMASELRLLQDYRYVSPFGEKRKLQILSDISEKDHKQLMADAKAGRVSYRETFLGGCAKRGSACPLGGISNITGCLGYGACPPCEWALVDRNKLSVIKRLLAKFKQQVREAPVGSPLRNSLKASIESAKRAIHVIEST